MLISPLAGPDYTATRPSMTRKSIEASVKIFLVALILTFVWTLTQVAGILGFL